MIVLLVPVLLMLRGELVLPSGAVEIHGAALPSDRWKLNGGTNP